MCRESQEDTCHQLFVDDDKSNLKQAFNSVNIFVFIYVKPSILCNCIMDQ